MTIFPLSSFQDKIFAGIKSFPDINNFTLGFNLALKREKKTKWDTLVNPYRSTQFC